MNRSFDPLTLSEFARYYGFHYDRIDPAGLVEDVLFEMDRGLNGQTSSLPMIPAYISPAAAATPGKTVIALDAGGTNLRSALVTFDESGKALATDSRKTPMPGTEGPVGADAFFDEIAAHAAPLIEKAGAGLEGIGFCFSYPMEITKEADAVLLAFSKELDAPEVIGKTIGAGLRDALGRRKVAAPERIVMLNDTVATLLSGLSQRSAQGEFRGGESRVDAEAGPLVGFILGTGFNTAYPEKNIPKIGFDSPSRPQIVVCESGSFAHRYMGLLDREHDSATKNPGDYTFEKATAGAYLGTLTFHIIRQALKDGLFSFAKQDEFLSWPLLRTKDLNAFLHAPLARSGVIAELFGDDERDAISAFAYIASLITQRSALLSAAMVAAAVEKAGGGRDPFVPVSVAVDGTTFAVFKGMRSSLESYLHVILNRHRPCAYNIALVEQASLLGAAVAAVTAVTAKE